VARIGYARVSTRGQNDDSQVDELNAHGVDKLFIDHGVRGKHAARPELGKALGYLREGDVFVITRLSRAMRSLKDMLVLVDDLQKRGIDLVVTKQGIDTTTPTGRLTFHILAAIDQFERELIVEGTREGLAAARARGLGQRGAGGDPGQQQGQAGRRQQATARASRWESCSPHDRPHLRTPGSGPALPPARHTAAAVRHVLRWGGCAAAVTSQ